MMDNVAPWFVLFEQMNDNETKKYLDKYILK